MQDLLNRKPALYLMTSVYTGAHDSVVSFDFKLFGCHQPQGLRELSGLINFCYVVVGGV